MSVYLGNIKILEGVLGQDGVLTKGVDYHNTEDINAIISAAETQLYDELTEALGG